MRRLLCWLSLGAIHWSGTKGLGMFSDANRCSCCGADGYGLLVLFGDPAEPRLGLFQRQVITGSQGTKRLTRVALTPSTRWGQVLLHVFHRPDEDPDPHSHPWPFWTLPLSGSYVEEVLCSDGVVRTQRVQWLRPHRRPVTHAHRVVRWTGPRRFLVTLFWRPAALRDWGFWMPVTEYGHAEACGQRLRRLEHEPVPTRFLVHWRDYLHWRAILARLPDVPGASR